MEKALGLLERAGSARAFLATIGGEGRLLARRPRANPHPMITPGMILGTFRGRVLEVPKYRNLYYSDAPALTRVQALALEMSLHEAAERRALEGELAALRAAWREAEEIAQIADALPGEPPQLRSS